MPQVISVEEVKKVKELLKEINFLQAKVGIMIETPAAVQLIRELCEEGIDFISFGTNDLTQYILALDRGNEQVQHLYNEMHPAVLHQLEYVIRVCKRNNVETSICGQAGSRKEMVKFLVEKGIDSISVNADMAKEISDYIEEVERELIKDTDKEPRQYKPEKKEKIEEEFVKSQNLGDVEKDIKKIEEEKREYLEEHPEEENKEEINEIKNQEIPQINGIENLQEEPEEDKALDIF